MLKRNSQVLLTAYLIYILYIVGFQWVFAPIHYGILFYVAAIFYPIVFFFTWYGNFYSETEAKRGQKSMTRSITYKSNTAFHWAGVISIVMLLISITLLLCSMWLNQNEICFIPWILQGLIFLAGIGILCAIPHICKLIGKNHQAAYTARIPEKYIKEREETLKDRPYKNHWITDSEYQDAKTLVNNVIVNKLNISRSRLTHGVTFRQLGVDTQKHQEIDLAIHDIIEDRYHYETFFGVEAKSIEGKAYIERCATTYNYMTNDARRVMYYIHKDKSYASKIKDTAIVMPSVDNYYDFVADVIHYHNTHSF